MKFVKIMNNYGVLIDAELAAMMMDEELREELHATIAPCTEQDFFNAYCEAHQEKFGEEFELAKECPVY